jgi:hypothetical protein
VKIYLLWSLTDRDIHKFRKIFLLAIGNDLPNPIGHSFPAKYTVRPTLACFMVCYRFAILLVPISIGMKPYAFLLRLDDPHRC